MTLSNVLADTTKISGWVFGVLRLAYSDILWIVLGSGGLVRLSELTLIKIHRSLQHSLPIEN